MRLITSIKKNEGFSSKPYLDTTGHLTIGYGTKLPITKKEAELLLFHRLVEKIKELEKKYPKFNNLDGLVQMMLIEMSYQMGVKGVLSFTDMLKHLENENYDLAYKEGLDSLWYRQTPNRARRVLKVLRE